jgi:hypothetical protein
MLFFILFDYSVKEVNCNIVILKYYFEMRLNNFPLKTCFIIVLVILKSLIPVVNAQLPDYETSGSKNYLPVFYKNLADRQVYLIDTAVPGRNSLPR